MDREMAKGVRGDRPGLRGRLRNPVVQFGLAGVAATLVVSVAAAVLLREEGIDAAVHDAEELASLVSEGIVEPHLTPGVLTGRPDQVRRFDRTIRRRVVSREPVVRVKIWSPTGEIVYSDEPRLIGDRYELEDRDFDVLASGIPNAEPSNLSQPENRFERGYGELFEVYRPIDGPDGQPLLFESYIQSSTVAESGERMWLELAPLMIGALVVLAMLQLPLAWSLARRLRRGEAERVRLLERTMDASETERRRIAQDLHDGVVQDLAGVSYAMAAAAERSRYGSGKESASFERAAAQTRQSLRELRALLVNIYPQDLHRAGLQAALSDLATTVRSEGVDAQVDIQSGLDLPKPTEALFYRGAQEGLRNVVAHSGAEHASVSVAQHDGVATLKVSDDGVGFKPNGQGSQPGHLGLRVLADLVKEAGGTWELDSAPGRGTRIEMAVPVE